MKHRIDRKDTLANAFSCHLEQMIIPYNNSNDDPNQ
jgi:hypothetical protein